LLNAIFLTLNQAWPANKDKLVEAVMQYLSSSGSS
jgi:hypothetical protein